MKKTATKKTASKENKNTGLEKKLGFGGAPGFCAVSAAGAVLAAIFTERGFGDTPPVCAKDARSEAIVRTVTSARGEGTFGTGTFSGLLGEVFWSIKTNITLIITE